MFLAPLSPPDTAGLDLRNDMRFLALERALDGASRMARADRIAKGNTGDVTLDWAGLLDQAESLAQTGRDLRLLVIAARILTNLRGPAGLAEGLAGLSETLDTCWDQLHPALRDGATGADAALRRINALRQIENADAGILCDLEFNAALQPQGLPVVSGGDLAASIVTPAMLAAEGPTGLSAAEQTERAARHETRVQRVATACRATRDLDPQAVAALEAGLAAAILALTRLESVLQRRTEAETPLRFQTLGQLLTRMQAALALPAMQPAPVVPVPGAAPVGMPVPPVAGGVPQQALPARLGARAEVNGCLDLIIDFYERNEPASPMPQLARRMKRMVQMSFPELIEELAPGGMKEFRNAAGVTDEKGR